MLSFDLEFESFFGSMGVYLKTLILLVGFFCGLMVFLRSKSGFEVYKKKHVLIFIIFNLLYAATSFYSPAGFIEVFPRVASRLVLLAQIILLVANPLFTKRMVVFSTLASGLIVAITTSFAYFMGYVSYRSQFVLKSLDAEGRYSGFFTHPSVVSNNIAFAIFICFSYLFISQLRTKTRFTAHSFWVSAFCLVSLIPLIHSANLAGGRSGFLGIILATILTLALTLSVTVKSLPIIHTLFSSFSLLFLNFLWFVVPALTLISSAVFFPAVSFINNYAPLFTRREDVGEALFDLATLNYRTVFWPELILEGLKTPFWGHGFASSQFVLEKINVDLGHAHNVAIEIFLTSGLIGLILYLVTLNISVFSLLNDLKRERDSHSFLILGLIVICSTNFIFQSFSFVGGGLNSMLLVYMMLSLVALRKSEYRT